MIDRTRLTQPTRLVLLEDFEQRTEDWRDRVDTKMEKLTSRVDVMGAKLAVYATVGAVAGGAAAAGVVRLIFG